MALQREITVDRVLQTSLSDILRHRNEFLHAWDTQPHRAARGRTALAAAEAEWRAAIAAVEHVLKTLPRLTNTHDERHSSIVLSGPLPILHDIRGPRFDSWVITPQPLADALNGQSRLLPAHGSPGPEDGSHTIRALPLSLQGITPEQFCLAITPAFSIGIVLGQPAGEGLYVQYSFDPEVVVLLWQQLRSQLASAATDRAEALNDRILQRVSAPDYRVVTQFTQVLLAHLPHRLDPNPAISAPAAASHIRFANWSPDGVRAVSEPARTAAVAAPPEAAAKESSQDVELLQAMAHEIRTPLTTIRTLTRSLMRRRDLPPEAHKRLTRIDQECTQQIDRFNLIFRAVELETTRDKPRSALTPIALSQVFQDAIPRWQQQAQRRNLSLDVQLPQELPRITSDPTLLNQVLTGVVEWFTQCLPAQSHIQMQVTLAGHQLKLQFESAAEASDCLLQSSKNSRRKPLRTLGQVLTLAPETGGLSLNLDVTKNLFQALGGKLTVRQRPQQGEVLTVFLPLDTREV